MSLRRIFTVSVALLCLFALTASASAAPIIDLPDPVTPEPDPFSDRYPALIYLPARADLDLLQAMRIDIDDLQLASGGRVLPGPDQPYQPLIATVYVNPAEADVLEQTGLDVIPIPNETLQGSTPGINAPPSTWPTYTVIEDRMLAMETNYPTLANRVSIGATVQGRTIWCVQISDNVDTSENEPEVRYISSLHGNETTGIEMTLRLAELLLSSYGTDPNLTALVDGMEIWLCPLANPDGYMNNSRTNANGYDLNRSFPDRFDDPSDTPNGRQAEVQAFWYFTKAHHFVMGANYHGGAQVANVPWDAIDSGPTYAPDDTIFLNWAMGYAALNVDLLNGGWTNGVTRGWEWYEIYGGMQDWAYYYNGEHHITIELSNTKAPNFSTMPTYWDHNRDAMLYWMSQALTGLHGRVLDGFTNAPLDATVTIQGMSLPNFIKTDPAVGDYHRVINAGSYTLVAAASGYESQSHAVSVTNGQATTQDFYLCPLGVENLSGTVTEAVSGLPLQATIEVVELAVQTTSDAQDGQYALSVCPLDSYTLRTSAEGYVTQERLVAITASSVEDFALEKVFIAPDLAASTKTASTASALPGEVVTYTIVADNATTAAGIAITDTLPAGLDWGGVLTATHGLPVYADGQITWSGVLTPGQPLTITYGASVAACQMVSATITNQAEFNNGFGTLLSRAADVQVLNAAPPAPALLSPADSSEQPPAQATLTWQAPNDINCDPLTYMVYFGAENPPPVATFGLTETTFTTGDLLPGTTYYWRVVVSDGHTSSGSAVWQFSIATPPPPPLRFFIPYLSRGH